MTSCPNCQSTVPASSRFCPNCGTATGLDTPPPPSPAEQPAPASAKSPTWAELTTKLGRKPTLKEWKEAQIGRKSSKIRTFVIVVFALIVGLLLLGAIVNSCNPSKTDGTNPSPQSSLKTQQVLRVGDSVTVGYWTYRVNSVKWAKTVGPEFMRQTADANFMVLEMSVMNNDKTASTLPPLKLVDADAREFQESSAGMMLQNAFGPLKQLNPTVQSNGMVVFDIPRGKYWLEVSGGIESSETSRIELP